MLPPYQPAPCFDQRPRTQKCEKHRALHLPWCLVLDPLVVQGLLSSVTIFGIHLQQVTLDQKLVPLKLHIFTNTKDLKVLLFVSVCLLSVSMGSADQSLGILRDILPIRRIEVEVSQTHLIGFPHQPPDVVAQKK